MMRRPAVLLLLLLLLGLGPAVPAAAQAPVLWTVDPAHSRLGFLFEQSGSRYEGRFARWTAEIAFDPGDLAHSTVAVVINLASADTGSDQRDELLRSASLFDVADYPEGRFLADEIAATGADRYEARGQLTLRDVTRDVVLPFSLTIADGRASASGRLGIRRLDYGVGQGQWHDTGMVGDAVTIVFELVATRAE
ncbi:Polyisoprenoid-binding protein YceI [Tistlia consotensis]|uniref:Polyisoprenoid-binding protein YceI n=1 Tax=Tistlia consotensis USBA 355 TaxID=560819 RepID=A0A1Y6B846_9PROT|nr:YceI family protein [Tistlia consotensis]SME97931.1 Polyisoprenoid-binding protein YceI [Tistlia consotensis USBA 355]SNR57304.1 Polyisoprenoid-binding protein YceI [Tistlia consotensis]